jgi:hypothetical protein
VLNYPAWQVEVSGSRIDPEKAEDSGQVIIPVPAGTSRVTMHFARTRDRTIGSILFILSSLAAVSLLVWPRRAHRR